MAPRTIEQKRIDVIIAENESLKAQLAFLGGAVCGAIHEDSVKGLDSMIDHVPYLQSLPLFVAMRERRAKLAAAPPEGTA